MMKLHFSLAFMIILYGSHTYAQNDYKRDWTMINGDAQRTSYDRMELEFPLQIKSFLQMPGFRESGMSYEGGFVYVTGYGPAENTLIAFDINDGSSRIWDFPVPGTASSGNFVPVIAGDLILASGQGADKLYCLTRETGDTVWTRPSRSFYTRSPVISNGIVYYGQDSVYAVQQLTGHTLWTYPEVIPQITPVIYGDTVYLGNDSGVFALNAVDGFLVWKNEGISIQAFTSLTVDQSRLYVGMADSLVVVDRKTGIFDWGYGIPEGYMLIDHPNGLCISEDHLLVKAMNGIDTTKFTVFEKSTGNLVANWGIPVSNYLGPTLINNMVTELVGNSLHLYDFMSGELQYGFPLGDFPALSLNQIIVADGYIVLGGNGSVLVLEPGMSTGTSAHSSGQFRFTCSPNPFQDKIEIAISLDQTALVDLFLSDARGMKVSDVFHGQIMEGTHTFSTNISLIPTGFYTVTAVVNNRQVQSEVLIRASPVGQFLRGVSRSKRIGQQFFSESNLKADLFRGQPRSSENHTIM
jgi:outer membrane protein assembly factor BamB